MTGKSLPLSKVDELTPEELALRAAKREHVLHLLKVQRLENKAAIHARTPGRWPVAR